MHDEVNTYIKILSVKTLDVSYDLAAVNFKLLTSCVKRKKKNTQPVTAIRIASLARARTNITFCRAIFISRSKGNVSPPTDYSCESRARVKVRRYTGRKYNGAETGRANIIPTLRFIE